MKLTEFRKGAPLHTLELRFPPLPQTFLKVMELMEEAEEVDAARVTNVIQHDPAAVTRVLRIANSAYYGQRAEIDSLYRAVVVLGPVSVLGIIMSMGLVDMRAALSSQIAVPFLNLVRHSVATGFLARALHRDVRAAACAEPEGAAYTAGLLHDFGKVVLIYNFPGEARPFYETSRDGDDAAWLEAEREAFGYDHLQTGLYFMRHQNFPDTICQSVARHHEQIDVGGDGEAAPRSEHLKALMLSVAAADRAANALGFGFNRATNWEACVEDPVWAHLADASSRAVDVGALLEIVQTQQESLAAYVDSIA
jgi:putative nucleotidyltransferase with HDIG domain